MEKLENKNISLSHNLYEKVVLTYVKKPVLNIFLGDFDNDTNKLSEIFDVKSISKGDIQLLHIRLDESLGDILCHYNPGKYSITFNNKNTLRNDFNVMSPELINKICIYAKQHRYEEKGKLSVNIVLSSSDKLYKFLDMILQEMELLLKKAFVNGVDVSLFNVYEENFNVNLNQSKENLDFISIIYDIVNKHLKIVNGVYFLSNYNNNEIYTNTFITNILYQISLYIRIKVVNNRVLFENFKGFSENEFLYISDYLKKIHKFSSTQYCCALGAFKLNKPDKFIKEIIELSILNQNQRKLSLSTSQILYELKLNSLLLSTEINNLLTHMSNITKKVKFSNSVQCYNTWIDKLKEKYKLSLIQDNFVNESNKLLANYIEEKVSKTQYLLYVLVNEKSLSVYNLKELLNNVIKQLSTELKKCNDENCKLEDELNAWEENQHPTKFPNFILNLYTNSNIVNFIEFFLLKNWKKTYLKLLKNKLIIQFYESFIKYFSGMFDLSLHSQKTIEQNRQSIKYQIIQSSSELDSMQIKNTVEHYSCLITSLFDKDNYNLNENLFCDNLFNEGSFEEAVQNTMKRVKKVATKIYDEYVRDINYLEEFCSRVGTDKSDAYSIFLDELYGSNPVTLRVIENEKLYKQLCICVPYDFEVDDDLIEAIKSSENYENINIIKTSEVKNMHVLCVNGNIDMNDIFHF